MASAIVRDLVDLWFPPRCAICELARSSPCTGCVELLAPADDLVPPDGVDDVLALLRYDERSRPLVAALKYRGRRDVAVDLAAPLARLLEGAAIRSGSAPTPVLTWAPTTAARRRARGYDQAEVVARAVTRVTGIRLRRLLRRHPGPSQTGRARLDRLTGVGFSALGPVAGTVVVCDDVLTTGATLSAAAEALRRAGAAHVVGLVVARTPPG